MNVPILLYHSISDHASPSFRPWTVRPATFAAHMQALHDLGYRPLTVPQLVLAMASGGSALSERLAAITFDDGFADLLTALPVLQRLGFPATLYVATGYVGASSRWLAGQGEGERPMLTWSQIAELGASGIEYGGHTCHHVSLDILPPALARQEIVGCKEDLEQHLGRPVRTFAYPHSYYTRGVQACVRQAGYTSACGVGHALSGPEDDPFALARIIVDSSVDVPALRRLLAGQGLRWAPRCGRGRAMLWRMWRRLRGFAQHEQTGALAA